MESRPYLAYHNYEVWNLFTMLDNSRTCGLGLNPISFTDIHSLFLLCNIPEFYWIEYTHKIASLDAVRLKYLNSKTAKPKKA